MRRMNQIILVTAAILLVAVPFSASAQRTTGEAINKALTADDGQAGLAKPVEAPPKNAWQKWTRFIDSELGRVGDMDLYGVTAQLPKGYFSIKWDYSQLKAGRRYNSKHELGPAIAPISLSALGIGEGKLDLGLSGHGGGHVFQASYGITDALDWYFELPYQFMHVRLSPKLLNEDGSLFGGSSAAAEVAGRNTLRTLLPTVGRPVPGLSYDADWVLADINTGFSWNPWRTERLSTALTARVFLPTGRVANPDNSLLYATGPELDTGLGGWAVGFTNGWDLRIYKYSYWVDIILSSEFTASYGFKQNRHYPTVIDDPNDTTTRGFRKPAVASPPEFPDLTKSNAEFGTTVGGNFEYTPGWSVDWLTQLNFHFAMLGIGVGYGASHAQEPEIDGDYRFIQMAKSLELLGQQSYQAIQVGGSISLFPLYIPVNISVNWRKMIDGYNAIVFDDYWNVVVKTYIPLFPDSKK